MIKLSPHFLGCLFRFSPIQPGLCPGELVLSSRCVGASALPVSVVGGFLHDQLVIWFSRILMTSCCLSTYILVSKFLCYLLSHFSFLWAYFVISFPFRGLHPGPGIEPASSSYPSHCSDSAQSLTCWATWELQHILVNDAYNCIVWNGSWYTGGGYVNQYNIWH